MAFDPETSIVRYKEIYHEAPDIPDIVMQELYKTGHTPKVCNDGDCGHLADRIVQRLGKGKVLTTDEVDVGGRFRKSRHEWVYVDGKHYDSETPYGVRTPRDLGYFRRLENKSMPLTNYEPDLMADSDNDEAAND